jgi:hypothetical protein
LKATWQKQVIASNGYRELGMFDDAANALEEIEPEDKTRNEVFYARVTTVRYAPIGYEQTRPTSEALSGALLAPRAVQRSRLHI